MPYSEITGSDEESAVRQNLVGVKRASCLFQKGILVGLLAGVVLASVVGGPTLWQQLHLTITHSGKPISATSLYKLGGKKKVILDNSYSSWAYGPQRASTSTYTDEALSDEVKFLPGAPLGLNFKVFAGYITVPGKGNMFYILTESASAPATDPLMWWSNGGPGASGTMATFEGFGPFRTNQKGNLDINPTSWNRLCNMVMVEQPLGVGFSTNSSPINWDDDSSAENNYAFMEGFLKRYPHFKTSDFYIASESYGGHYVPTFAKVLLDKGGDPAANFKGFLVGNPVSVWEWSKLAQLETLANHDMIPRPMWEKFKELGCSRFFGVPFGPQPVAGESPDTPQYKTCSDLGMKMVSDAAFSFPNSRVPRWERGPMIDQYAIYYPECTNWIQDFVTLQHGKGDVHNLLTQEQLATLERVMNKHFPPGQTHSKYFPFKYDPCIKAWHFLYMQRRDVRNALHVDQSVGDWWLTLNKTILDTYYAESESTLNPMPRIYDELSKKKKGLRMLVFSGDNDLSVPATATQYWIWTTGAKWSRWEDAPGRPFSPWGKWRSQGGKDRGIVSNWTTWKIDMPSLGEQVAGYRVKFDDGLTYMTVLGGGHEIGLTRPWAGLRLLEDFLNDKV